MADCVLLDGRRVRIHCSFVVTMRIRKSPRRFFWLHPDIY